MTAKIAAGTPRVPSAVVQWARQFGWLTFSLAIASAIALPSAVAQPRLEIPTVELSDVVQVDEVDRATMSLLEVAKALLSQHQWGEAIEKLQQVEKSAGDKLFKAEPRRFVPLRQYCQLLVARLPEAGLSAYRENVDSLAKEWYDDGIAARDGRALQKVVDHYFNSSSGDDALMALGEIALERGEPQRAFSLWEQISHKLRPAGGLPRWLAYPDTNLDLADVRARLVLASIMAGDLRWAKVELKALNQNHPGAKGKLGGRELLYADALAAMIEAAKSWPRPVEPNGGWPTFSGSPTRQRIAHGEFSLKDRLVDIPVPVQTSAVLTDSEPVPGGPVAPDSSIIQLKNGAPALSYFPVVARGRLLFNSADEIFAYDAGTGKPAWEGDLQKPGRIFWGGRAASPAASRGRARLPTVTGAPRFTLTVFDRWLLARMGSPVTAGASQQRRELDASYIVCLDLAAEGRLNWRLAPDDAQWAFEGSPASDGTNVFVAMRHSDGTGMPQEHVACFDLQSGALRWRQMVCAAESLSAGDEVSYNLLTLVDEQLYLNTNHGAIASLDSADGHIRWLTTYCRLRHFDADRINSQNVNPAVYDRGTLFAAPADFSGILALDAVTGQLQWDSETPSDVTQLLGVSGGKLWASGKSLWALDARGGKVEYHSAAATAAAAKPAVVGHGRGLLAGGNVYWPVQIAEADEKDQPADYRIRIFDAQTTEELPPLRLSALNPPCKSGNLLKTDQNFVIAGPERIVLFASPRQAEQKNSTD